ncbi:uncharacterized protein Z518_09707 [Rhinocladiella mackenziei CBS 650.93]|uniref:Small ribosomal subunit protein mS35 mitochondrial conserved domain-containing protein n=1 Tax=Rhinocladiella mackenziei CBS 650.93 TaxID=1442369 RepID=A0A0D2FF52_9EURO|nr:uncharacterized protein Z518_09707 [Rhinocladiella mackenziei CBS 650.93]KIX00642.1 hypothetical protein Z518_09707 [Rhinocladiella mackenziei CBS 650.93]
MANPARCLCRILIQGSRQIPVKRKCQQQFLVRHRVPGPFRQFSTTYPRRADKPAKSGSVRDLADNAENDDRSDLVGPGPSKYQTPRIPITVADLDPEERADYDLLSENERKEYLALQNHYAAVFESAQAEEALEGLVNEVDRTVEKEAPGVDFPDIPLPRRDEGYWASDEDDEFGQVEDDEDSADDSAITSVAHSELELHREVREYTRVIAWDMPLLQQFAKPFRPPTEATPLRFRYTTYMGEVHPAAKKVVVQFCTKDLPNLTEAQRIKLVKLVGVRYNPDTDVVKMSCERFEAPAQNKRYLGDLVNKLLDEARHGGDTFEDVPLDFRHHTSKKEYTFPEEWKLKPARVQQLLTTRQNQRLLEMKDTATLDGKETVKSYVQNLGITL